MWTQVVKLQNLYFNLLHETTPAAERRQPPPSPWPEVRKKPTSDSEWTNICWMSKCAGKLSLCHSWRFWSNRHLSLPHSPLCPLPTCFPASPTPEPCWNISASACSLPTLWPPSSSSSKPRMLQPRLVNWSPSSVLLGWEEGQRRPETWPELLYEGRLPGLSPWGGSGCWNPISPDMQAQE